MLFVVRSTFVSCLDSYKLTCAFRLGSYVRDTFGRMEAMYVSADPLLAVSVLGPYTFVGVVLHCVAQVVLFRFKLKALYQVCL